MDARMAAGTATVLVMALQYGYVARALGKRGVQACFLGGRLTSASGGVLCGIQQRVPEKLSSWSHGRGAGGSSRAH